MGQISELEIRKIARGESFRCAGIYAGAWNFALPESQRDISIDDFEGETEGELTVVAVLNDQIVGYMSIWEADWFLHHIYVDPPAHGNGIGNALISHLEELAQPHQISLKCQLANTAAIGFYHSLGFSFAPERGVDEYGEWVRLEKSLA